MAGITDAPFRKICRKYGAGLTVSEMTTADIELWKTKKSKRRLNIDLDTEPKVVQIAGSEPYLMGLAANLCAANGVQIIDINMGCPAKKVCNKLAGSALLKDIKQVRKILKSVIGAVDIPVTLKMRTGWDDNTKNAPEIAKIAENEGIKLITIHGRTRSCHFRGDAEYKTIAQIKKLVTIPVVANGDITTPEKSLEVLHISCADALMIGRAARGQPWIFEDLNYYYKTGKKNKPLEKNKVHDIMLEHLLGLYQFYGDITGVRVARKHLVWYCANLVNSELFRAKVVRVNSAAEQVKLTTEYFSCDATDTPLVTQGNRT